MVTRASAVDDDDVVRQALDLGQQAARDEDRAPGAPHGRAAASAGRDPAGPGRRRARPARRNVHCCSSGQPEGHSLSHAEEQALTRRLRRAALDVPSSQDLVDGDGPREAPPASASTRRLPRPLRPGWTCSPRSYSYLDALAGRRGHGAHWSPMVAPSGALPGEAEQIFIVVDFPAPFGPRKLVTRPGIDVKVRSSRTDVGPVRLAQMLYQQRNHVPSSDRDASLAGHLHHGPRNGLVSGSNGPWSTCPRSHRSRCRDPSPRGGAHAQPARVFRP